MSGAHLYRVLFFRKCVTGIKHKAGLPFNLFLSTALFSCVYLPLMFNYQAMTGENQTIYETNRKLFYEWSIQLFLNGELSQQEESQLQTLTASGQTDGGLAPRDARTLLPKCNGTDAVSRDQSRRYLKKYETDLQRELMTLAPNPASKSVSIGLDGVNTGLVTLSDLMGKTWLVKDVSTGAKHLELHTDQLPVGIYVISFLSDAGHYISRKLIVQH